MENSKEFSNSLEILKAICEFISKEKDGDSRRILGINLGISASTVSVRPSETSPAIEDFELRAGNLCRLIRASGAKRVTVEVFDKGKKTAMTVSQEDDSGAPEGWYMRAETGTDNNSVPADTAEVQDIVSQRIGKVLTKNGDVYLNGKKVKITG